MNLAQLINILEMPLENATDLSSHDLTQPITSIHYRSQDTRPGGLFVAIEGFTADGHAFIADAVKNGATAICAQKPTNAHVPVLVVPDTRRALAAIAARFYAHPARDLTLIGITGTSGKTTVTYLLENILSTAGHRCGVIGTINYRFDGKTFPNPVTTPESLDLQRILADMLNAGVSHVVMEVSSHALDLHRVDHCDFDVAVFTNLTQDHLDYHRDMASYWQCKKRLFHEHLKPLDDKNVQARAVINCDGEYGRNLYKELTCPEFSTGVSQNAAVQATNPQFSQAGITADIKTPAGDLNIVSALVGRHNLENILSAVGAASALQIDLNAIKNGIEKVRFVPGRLEAVPNDKGRHVYVDYAHKPDALSKVLNTLRPLLSGRLICVMGCGGDRDRTKRPIMGEIAGRLSDLTIVTSDNPRNEPPDAIISQIEAGVRRSVERRLSRKAVWSGFSGKGYVVEPDRGKAIQMAVAASEVNDTILIAGKGHENYQIIGSETIPFDDVQQAKAALGSESADQWLKN